MIADLAVVVIARNEEVRIRASIAACLSSLQRALVANLVRTWELVLVDSASTDRTVEIAKEFPITIIKLGADWPLSAAAGRFVGLRNTDSDLVLFVDGDYVLFDDWLPEAIRAIRKEQRIGAVCGRDVEEATGDSLLMRFSKQSTESLVGEPEAIPIGLYRRQAITEVGGIHPFLRGGEDRDLACRLRAAGYQLLRINHVMGLHRWSDAGPLNFITYFRSVLVWSIGDGQSLRARFEFRPIRDAALRRYANVRHLFNYMVGLVLVAFAIANSALLSAAALPYVLLSDFALFLVLQSVRKRRGWTWRELLFRFHVVPYSIVRHSGFIAGFLFRPRDPLRYPTGEQISHGHHH